MWIKKCGRMLELKRILQRTQILELSYVIAGAYYQYRYKIFVWQSVLQAPKADPLDLIKAYKVVIVELSG